MRNKIPQKRRAVARLLATMAFAVALLLTSVGVDAQTRTITGRVLDQSGQPVPGAAVMEKGTSNGTVTDIDGNYTLQNVQGGTLAVSFIGYKNQEAEVAGTSQNFTLEDDLQELGEVVAIGYGTQRKEAVTGSVANVGGATLNQVAAPSAAYALQGRVPGVVMTQTDSKPGAEMQIRIRGQRSLSASNDPLIVLDGIPFMGALSDINPGDIKSLDILKDASATAIYGSRGANGVIMITTIKGAQGQKAQFTYNGYIGPKKIFSYYPMMSGPQYAALRKAAVSTTSVKVKDENGKDTDVVDHVEFGDKPLYSNTGDERDDVDTDWQKMLIQRGMTMSHDVGVMGGTEGGSYSFGAGYYLDKGIIPSQEFRRISVRGNFDQKVAKWFRFGLSTNTSYRQTKGGNVGIELAIPSIADPYDEEGNLKRYINSGGGKDTYMITTKDVVKDHEDDWLSENRGLGTYNTFFGEVEFPGTQGLKYRINVGLNYRQNKYGGFTGTGVRDKDPNYQNGASVSESNTRQWTVENLLTYDHTWKNKHTLNFVGMYSAEQQTSEGEGMSSNGVLVEYYQYYAMDKTSKDVNASGSYSQSGLCSWMARAMYNYDNRYMVSVAFRGDGSSRLAEGHKWHTYPAVSIGWNIAREKFVSNNTGVIDNLKLRIGYGQTSNQSVGAYSTRGSLRQYNYNFGSTYRTGYYVSSAPNDQLGWEYSSTWNFGVDYSFFSGRLSGSIEAYTMKTKDILLGVSMPATSGIGSYTGNIGETSNKGFEFNVSGDIIRDLNGWNWNVGFNIYFNRNKLESLASGVEKDEGNRWFVGHPIDVIYDYKKVGLWNSDDPDYQWLQTLEPGGNEGMIKVEYTGERDASGKPLRAIGEDDRQIIEIEPKFNGGLTTTLSWRGIDLSLISSFQNGGIVINTLYTGYSNLNNLDGRRANVDVDYWTPDNKGAKYPRPGGLNTNDSPKYNSTLGYFDAGYFKMRTMTLGYNFDSIENFEKSGMKKLRVYFSVNNPFVAGSDVYDESGLDPETNAKSSGGQGALSLNLPGHTIPVIGYNTPQTRSFLFGLNLTF